MNRALRGGRRGIGRLAVALAGRWRRRLGGVVFVGVTGSCGKTTTKDLVAAVLSARLRGRANPGTANGLPKVVLRILSTRPGDAFCVQEVAAGGPGSLDRTVELLQPRVAVVTHVGFDHYKAFRGLEAVAAEKGKLVAALPEAGVAVLNADDPHVLAMGARCRGRVLTYGMAAGAEVAGSGVTGAWPDRLALTATHGGRSVQVRTRLCGTHWAHAVLAALATGVAMGIPLEEGAAAVERVEPFPGRMCPVPGPGGVTFISDEWKAPVWSLPAVWDFLRAARAERKVVVLGTLSDYSSSNSRTYAAVARQALEVAQRVVFVGRWSRGALRAGGSVPSGALHAVAGVPEARALLADLLRPGDLVLLKGSKKDRLQRLLPPRRGGR